MTDWPKIITELVARLGSQAKVAAAASMGRSTLTELRLGTIKEPGHSAGERILKLWRRK